jgi:hypothetical protein
MNSLVLGFVGVGTKTHYLALDVRHDAALRAPSSEGFLLAPQCVVVISELELNSAPLA